jgi:hypothetical protein
MPIVSSKVAVGIAIVVIASTVVLVISRLSREPSRLPGGSSSLPAVMVHDAAWYVAHPQAMQIDEAKCQRNDREVPIQACQNITSAEQQLASSQLQSVNGGK